MLQADSRRPEARAAERRSGQAHHDLPLSRDLVTARDRITGRNRVKHRHIVIDPPLVKLVYLDSGPVR